MSAGGADCPADSSTCKWEEVCWYRVLPSAGLGRRHLRKVSVAGRDVLLARLENGVLAAASVVCPHEGADLSEGTLYMGAIDCPRHHYLYDLRTGRNRYPRNVFPAGRAAALSPLACFPVREKDGWIWVGRTWM